MYFIIFLITFLIEATVPTFGNQIDEGTDGVLIKKTFIRDMRAANLILTCPDDASGFICADDCETLMACEKGVSQPIDIAICANISSSTPYCIPGGTECSATADIKNPQCEAEEIQTSSCTNTGYFPHPSDCTSYHKCTRDVRETYKCPPNHVFDPTNTKCKLRERFTSCSTINCRDSMNQYVPYPGHKSYYAYCERHEITMFKCDDIHNFEFNPKTLECDYKCKSTGWFPHHKNSHQYYECYKHHKKCHHHHGHHHHGHHHHGHHHHGHHHHGHHNRFKSRLHKCPQNYVFDAKHRQCVEHSGSCSSCSNERIPVGTKKPPPTSRP